MKLELYLLKQLAVAFLFAVGGMMFVALPGIAVAAVHKLAGVDLIVVLRFLPLLAAGLIPYVLPIGYLLAVVVTFGRLAADNEWTAILMCGRNPWRILLPALFFGGVLSAGTYGMVSRVLPYLKKETRSFQIAAVSDVIKNISPGRTEVRFGDFYLSSSFRDGDEFLDALIHFPGEEYKMIAESVRFEFVGGQMIVHLKNYQVVAPGLRGRMEQGTLAADLESFIGKREMDYRRAKYLRSPELLELIRSGTLEGKDLLRAQYEFHNRFARAASFIMYLLLGAATGLLFRRGTQLGALAIAVGYALAYYVLSMRLGKELAISGVLHPIFGAWITTFLGACCGVWLVARALRH